jgi:hypothetical protein
MRRADETPIDPEIAAPLDAIDATLAGEAVDPEHAELAELALLLADERPRPDPAFATGLDQRVAHRFARGRSAPRVRRWIWGPAAGLAVGVVVAVVVLAGTPSPNPSAQKAASSEAATTASPSARPGVPAPAPITPQAARASAASAAGAGAGALQPIPNGRKVIQAAQLALSASPGRVDDVAQEVFEVIGQHSGIVNSSTVTAGGTGGYAQFQLSVPSGSLSQTMAALSTLQYARVASRTDTSQDVNDQYLSDQGRLGDARALRTALLKQLANASTQAEIDSLTARIHDAEASIASDQAALRQLSHQVNFSQVTLTVNAGSAPFPGSRSGGGFTLGRATHDAGRVLTVAAGVILIVLAALVPLGLLGALGWWIATLARRRRREQALDAV